MTGQRPPVAPGGIKRVPSGGALHAMKPERPAASQAATAAALVNAAAAVVSSTATIASHDPTGTAQMLSAVAALAAGSVSIAAATIDAMEESRERKDAADSGP